MLRTEKSGLGFKPSKGPASGAPLSVTTIAVIGLAKRGASFPGSSLAPADISVLLAAPMNSSTVSVQTAEHI
jgi:hypothetical protein